METADLSRIVAATFDLSRPTAILDAHEDRLPIAGEPEDDLAFTLRLLVEQGRQASKEGRSDDLAVTLYRLGALVGCAEGLHATGERFASRFARDVLPMVQTAIKLAGSRAQRAGGKARVAKARARTAQLLAKVDRYQADVSRRVPRIDACRHVARRELGPNASDKSVERLAQRLARMGRKRRKPAITRPD